MGKKIKFGSKLIDVLDKMSENGDYIALEILYMAEEYSVYTNGLNIEYVDIGRDYTFNVKYGNNLYKLEPMKVSRFIKYFFEGSFDDVQISKFTNYYNKYKNNGKIEVVGEKIEVGKFKYNPKDPRSTFLSMVQKTYPHGHEEEVLQFLPSLKSDKFGNYYMIIGSSVSPETMFTSHLDTADRKQSSVNLLTRKDDNGDEIIYTDGTTILGADDKSGVVVMLYMMAHNIPGLYYFFVGEERGGIGSNKLASAYSDFEYLKNIKRCVSYDRRKTISVITRQMSRICCSNEFASALCDEYNKTGLNLSLDPTGVYTDSASFIDDIPECTNISVGYENEHTGRELQNMTYLTKLCESSLKVNWGSLPTTRKVGFDQEIINKYRGVIDEIKRGVFGIEIKVVGSEGRTWVRIDMDETDIDTVYDGLIMIHGVLKKWKVSTDVIVEDLYIKIELK